MAKTLNQFLEGYLKVKNPDEQKFVDKHVVAKHSDRNGNDDDAFKGKTKQIDRRKERHGYNPGEDEKVYEETLGESKYEFDISGEHGNAAVDKLVRHANSKGIKAKVHTYNGPGGGNPVIHLSHKDPKAVHAYVKKHIDPDVDLSHHKINEELKGNQHKIDANKNGKLDAHDFKLLRKKKMKEEIDSDLESELKAQRQTKKSLAAAKERRQAFSRANNVADMRKYAKEEADLQEGDGTGTYSVNSKHKKHNELVKAGFKHQAFKHGDGKVMHTYWSPGYRNADLQKVLGEEAEQIDELSTATLQSYRKKARAQGNAIVDKMKLGGGDWSKDQKDTKTLRKRAAGAQASGKQLVKRGESLKTEEVEELDELSRDTLRRYRMKAKSIGDNEKGDIGYRSKGRDLAARKTHGGQYGIPKAKVMAKEEVEELDELSKATLASYAKKAKHQMGHDYIHATQSDRHTPAETRAYAKRADRRYDGIDKAINKLAKEEVEIEEKINMDKASMGTVIKDFQKSDAPQFKGKSPEKRRAMAIAAKLTAERGGKPLRKEEKLADLLGDLTESHRRTMLSVFDKLNEDNQKKFLEACQTPEGVEYMLDFSISHRGE